MPELIVYLEAMHFYYHAHCQEEPPLAQRPTVILRAGEVIDCSPEIASVGGQLCYLRTAYPGLWEQPWAPEVYERLYELLWGQVAAVACAVEPLEYHRGFFEPARGRPADVRRDLDVLRERIRAATDGLEVALGAGPSRLVAQVAARAGRVVTSAEVRAFLAEAPIEWLPFHESALRHLGDLGVRRIGELASIGHGILYRCLGPENARRIVDLFGGSGESYVRPLYPPTCIDERVLFEEPPEELKLSGLLGISARRLWEKLATRRRWPRKLEVTLEPLDGPALHLSATLSRPPGSPEELARRFLGLFRQLWHGEQLLCVSLLGGELEPLLPAQYDLFGARTVREKKLQRLMEALQGRFGQGALFFAAQGPSCRRWAEQILAC